MQTIAVLLMAYGSPESLDDIEAYLLDIRGGRLTPPALVEEMRQRYNDIGGHDPLLDITRTQAAALQAAFEIRHGKNGVRFKTYVGMRHWKPRIAEALGQIKADGIQTILAMVMAPHQSRMSTGLYFARLAEAAEAVYPEVKIIPIEAWGSSPQFIAAIVEKIKDALPRFDAQPRVLFSAHSLPSRILQEGDLYQEQLLETARLVARGASLADGSWQFCFQSAGRSAEPWLGPTIEETIEDLAKKGEKNILVVPVGFVCDHLEVLYDIDIAARHLAAGKGIHLERTESLNTSPTFIRAVEEILWSSWKSHVEGAEPASSSHLTQTGD